MYTKSVHLKKSTRSALSRDFDVSGKVRIGAAPADRLAGGLSFEFLAPLKRDLTGCLAQRCRIFLLAKAPTGQALVNSSDQSVFKVKVRFWHWETPGERELFAAACLVVRIAE